MLSQVILFPVIWGHTHDRKKEAIFRSMLDMRHILKRATDIGLSTFGLLVFGWAIVLCWVIAAIETRSNGFFLQRRVGRNGKLFRIIKIKTMYNKGLDQRSSVTSSTTSPITRSGQVFRRFKLDELPQLINVLKGDMSFVGPRPDVPGFADKLEGNDRIILSVRPGITGPASLSFRNEEEILAGVSDPETHNREVLWPAKVKLNLEYVRDFGFWSDMKYIIKTVLR